MEQKHPLLEGKYGLRKLLNISNDRVYKEHPITKLWDSLYMQPFYNNKFIENDYSIIVNNQKVISYQRSSSQETKINGTIDQLLKYTKQSSFGQGELTLTDTNIRDSWEISAIDLNSYFLDKIKNNIWPNISSHFIRNTNFSLVAHKLLIYKKGGHFEEHVDSQHRKNHIGTVLADIPLSSYTGGDLILKHHGKEYTINLRSDLPYIINYVAFFNDIKHRVTPILSGERLVLQFDIVMDDKNEKVDDYREEFVGLEDENAISLYNDENFNSIFNDIKKNINILKKFPLAFMLKYRYANHELKPFMLKCLDKKLYQLLEKDYQLSLINVICNYYDDEENKYRYYQIWNRNNDNDKNITLFESTIQGLELFEQQEYIEYTGNESQPEIYRYLGSALVIEKKKN